MNSQRATIRIAARNFCCVCVEFLIRTDGESLYSKSRFGGELPLELYSVSLQRLPLKHFLWFLRALPVLQLLCFDYKAAARSLSAVPLIAST